jgi:hypothetical protein
MDPELGAPPRSLEDVAPPPPPAPKRSEATGPVKKVGATSPTHESVNYTSAAERCETCEHFNEEEMKCNKHNFEAEPEGHCDDFELLGAGEGGGEAVGEVPLEEGGEEEEDLEEEVY